MNNLTVEAAKAKIAELEQYVVDQEAKPEGVTIYRIDGNVLARTDAEDIKTAVEAHKADLMGANLRGADLMEAYLRGANLIGADLQAAIFYGKGGTTRIT